MVRHFLSVFLRTIRRNTFFSVINVAGFTIGFTSVIVLAIFLFSELSYDKFHRNYESIYRLTTVFASGGMETHYALNEGKWDNKLETDVAGVLHSTAFFTVYEDLLFKVDDKLFTHGRGLYSDEDFLKVFDFPVIAGDPSTALNAPNSLVLTRSVAEKLFGTTDVVGRTVTQKLPDEQLALNVTAVLEDVPANSSLRFDFIMPGRGSWWESQFIEGKSPGNTLHVYFATDGEMELSVVQENVDRAFAIKNDRDAARSYFTPVQRFRDLHWDAGLEFDIIQSGNWNYARIFFMVGVGLLVITIVNYINLTTARSMSRSKEIGVRKALGTGRKALILQFLSEAVVVTLITSVFSAFLAWWLVRNFIADYYSIELSLFTNYYAIAAILLFGIITGVLSGLYPAFRLSSLNTIAVLKGRVRRERPGAFGLRNVLVSVQLVTAVTLLAFCITTFRQVHFLRNKPLGYERNDLVSFFRPDAIPYSHWTDFQQKLKEESAFQSVGGCFYPLLSSMNKAQFTLVGSDINITAAYNYVDRDFVETLRMEMLAGRDFDPAFPSDSTAIIMNEAAMVALGLDDAIGKKVNYWLGDFEVIGVVRDFHYQSFNSAILPVFLVLENSAPPHLFARAQNLPPGEVVAAAQRAWKSAAIETPFEYSVFNDDFNELLKNEQASNEIITAFTLVTLAITGIGLVGLIGFISSETRKEISIRKVFGASVTNIFLLLGRTFGSVTLVGIVVSIPLVYLAVDAWLSGFQFKVAFRFVDLLLTWVVVSLFVLVVIVRQVIASANVNPTVVLREE